MQRTKNIFLPFMLLLCSIAFSSCGEEQGTLRGAVSFSGLPCQPGQPDFRVPPCTGPYPSYEIAIFKPGDLESPVVTTMTDSKGTYQLKLPVGQYIILTRNGPMATDQKENQFEIRKDEITALELRISTGIL